MDIQYFFRVAEDSAAPEVPLPFIIGCIAMMFYIARRLDRPKVFAWLAIAMQVMILTWYQLTGNLLADGLPLYHCRIAIWVLSIGILLDKRTKLMTWSSLIGMPFSLIVLLIRDMNEYQFPHITNVYYFAGHILIFLMSYHYLTEQPVKISSQALIFYTLAIHCGVELVNLLLGSDYSYLRRLPILSYGDINRYAFLIVTVCVLAMLFLMRWAVHLYWHSMKIAEPQPTTHD